MGNKRDIQTSPKSAKGRKSPRPNPRRKRKDIQQGGNTIRIVEDRRNRHSCCHDEERQKGMGAVLFTLGIPSVIAGIIMTIVAATDNDQDNKYPKSFIAIGPILLVLAVVFFVTGILLHNMHLRSAFQDCFSLEDPKGFCRVHCPTLSHFLHPDDSVIINQAAIKALQSEPGKSVLKRNRLLSDPTSGNSLFYPPNDIPQDAENNDVFDEEKVCKTYTLSRIKMPRGVRFSDGDVEELKRKRAGSNSSLLSLKHCKISPIEDEIWWTDEQEKNSILSLEKSKEEALQTTDL